MYKRRYIDINSEGHLLFSGYDTVKLAKDFGTPLYVVSEDEIRLRCKELREYFMDKYPNTFALYASKAFSNIAMYKIIKDEGLGLDVVSSGELYTAIKANFPTSNIYFHGNNKTQEEIIFGIENNVGCFVIDSFYEMEMIDAIAKDKNKKVKALLRISPGISGHTHEFISTGQLDSKFGFPIHGNIAIDAVSRVLKCQNIDFHGLHCHIGSQMLTDKVYSEASDIMTKLILDIKNELEVEIRELNIGGGFGIYYANEDEPLSINVFIDTIMESIIKRCNERGLCLPKVLIEPGRWLIGEAGITLYTVGSIKDIEGVRKYVSIDGGMADNLRPALYQAEYDAVLANKANLPKDDIISIAGKCCESGDMLIWDLKAPKVSSGDILAVLTTGAYNYSMSSNYNRLRKPAVVMIKDKTARVVVKRETYEDLIRNDLE